MNGSHSADPAAKSPFLLGISILGTAIWMLLLIRYMALAFASTPKKPSEAITFESEMVIRTVGAISMLVLGGCGIAWAAMKATRPPPSGRKSWLTDPFLLAMALFWALFPPMWFFTEYFAFDRGAIAPPADIAREKYLEGLKSYAGLASPIWAGLGTLYAVLLSHIKADDKRAN